MFRISDSADCWVADVDTQRLEQQGAENTGRPRPRKRGAHTETAVKRRRVFRALNHPEMSGWSNVKIARACDVSDVTVMRIRNEVQPLQSRASTSTGADGKQYPASKPPRIA
jgi:hypothetical protein